MQKCKCGATASEIVDLAMRASYTDTVLCVGNVRVGEDINDDEGPPDVYITGETDFPSSVGDLGIRNDHGNESVTVHMLICTRCRRVQ